MQVSKFRNTLSKRLQYRVYSKCRPFDTINEFLRYLEKKDFAANTVRASAYDLIRYFTFLSIIAISWSAIKLDNLVDYIYHLRHATPDNKISIIPINEFAARSESTINRMLCTVLSFYRYYYLQHGLLVELGNKGVFEESQNSYQKGFLSFAIGSHPHSIKWAQRLVKCSNLTKKIPKTITVLQQKQILSFCKNRRDQLLVLLLLETGMRVGQALQLKHQDIEAWSQRLLIEYRIDNENEVYSKSYYDYHVDLSAEWLDLYTNYIVHDLENSNSDYVFIKLYRKNAGDINEPLRYDSVKLLFNRFSKKLGVKITPHMLRHTHATELLRVGVPIEIVAKRLGHRSIETTRNVYEHLTAYDMKTILTKARENESRT